MTNEELEQRALGLIRAADSVNHPMLPKGIKQTIQAAARLVGELVRREVKRCHEQPTTEKP